MAADRVYTRTGDNALLNQYTSSPGDGTSNAYRYGYDLNGNMIARFEECGGDVTGDNVVNVNDAITFSQAYAAGQAGADYNADGEVNVNDLIDWNADFQRNDGRDCLNEVYAYDHRDQLWAYTRFNGLAQVVVEHVYDCFNRRIITREDTETAMGRSRQAR